LGCSRLETVKTFWLRDLARGAPGGVLAGADHERVDRHLGECAGGEGGAGEVEGAGAAPGYTCDDAAILRRSGAGSGSPRSDMHTEVTVYIRKKIGSRTQDTK
jgi:hypothetical protein